MNIRKRIVKVWDEEFKNNKMFYWIMAIAFFLFGDLLTTFYAMDIHGIVEMNSLYSEYFVNGIYDYFLFGKTFVLITLFVLYYVIDNKYDMYAKVIPITLAIMGFLITIWNSFVIYIALTL